MDGYLGQQQLPHYLHEPQGHTPYPGKKNQRCLAATCNTL